MAFNGVGVFTRIYQWTQDAANGIFVDATRTDTDSNDIAAGLTNCVTRDGQSPWLANIPAGGFKITGLVSGSASGDSANYGQVFNSPAFTSPSIVANPAPTDNSLLIPSTSWVNAVAMNAALPAQSLGFLRSDGSAASFTQTHTGYAQNEVKGADIASAATINLTTATGNLVHVTGTTTITAITIPNGAEREIVFDGTLTLTHNATTLILPTGTNITTAAGDCATVRGDGSGNARVVKYERASGQALITPAMRLLATLTPTAAANVDFLNTFSATYDDYLIIFDGIKPAADDRLSIRYAVAGSVVTGSNYFGADSNGTSTALTSVLVSTGTWLAAGIGSVGHIRIQNANHATQMKGGDMFSLLQTNATPTHLGSARWVGFNGGVVTGFRLYWESGNNFSAQGSVKVYGIAKT